MLASASRRWRRRRLLLLVGRGRLFQLWMVRLLVRRPVLSEPAVCWAMTIAASAQWPCSRTQMAVDRRIFNTATSAAFGMG